MPLMIAAEWRHTFTEAIFSDFYFWNCYWIFTLLKDELIDRLQVEHIEGKLEHLNKRFSNFLGKYNELHSELQVSRNCSNRVIVIELSNLKEMHLVQHSMLEEK